MDSWTPAQMDIMRKGGNQKCISYLSAKGILPTTPIKQKYESDAAQLYKHILKARAEGEFCVVIQFVLSVVFVESNVVIWAYHELDLFCIMLSKTVNRIRVVQENPNQPKFPKRNLT
mmetsp:Transcript_20011/g.37674  ORF Transcript_20011/g.37674 Transcript_20011/m.37674 type:complete len:117 (+) Transcript_20011:1892-2242(+)